MDELTAIADRLYAVPAEGFTAARNAAARDCTDKTLSAQVKKLRKPSVAGWAVNLLVRRESDQIASVLELAGSLRAAAEALDGDELRALTRQRRQLTAALTATARSLAHDVGVRLTGAVSDQVEGMLNAAMLDPVAAQVVRTGRVLSAFTATGVSEVDVASVVALPDELDVRAIPLEGPVTAAGVAAEASGEGGRPAALRVVPDNGAKIAAAKDAVEEASGRVTEAVQELAAAEQSVEALNARRLQLQGEADELRRRLAAIDDEVDGVDEELEEAEEARVDAKGAVEEARSTQTSAEETLAKLSS